MLHRDNKIINREEKPGKSVPVLEKNVVGMVKYHKCQLFLEQK